VIRSGGFDILTVVDASDCLNLQVGRARGKLISEGLRTRGSPRKMQYGYLLTARMPLLGQLECLTDNRHCRVDMAHGLWAESPEHVRSSLSFHHRAMTFALALPWSLKPDM